MSRTPTADLTKPREWHKTTPTADLLISTAPGLLDRAFIAAAFATPDMYWAKPLPPDQLEVLLAHSLTLGLYRVAPAAAPARSADEPSSPRTPSPTLEASAEGDTREQIGMARLVTDYVTFAYLTDVYVAPAWRTGGLGRWLVGCCREVVEGIPELRRAMLLTGPETGRRFYERELGWWEVGEERGSLACMTLKGWGFGG